MIPSDRPTLLNVIAHPDDEAIGASATALALQSFGWRIVVYACSLGRGEQQGRRRAELEAAATIAGWEAVVGDPLLRGSQDSEAGPAEESLTPSILRAIEEWQPAIIMSPHPHDAHPTHELVARSVASAVMQRGASTRWWQWSIWADLPLPTLYVPFADARLQQMLQVLSAHRGEVSRNDYRGLVRARAAANKVIGSERVLGFGNATASDEPYAELLTEILYDGRWRLGAARVLSSLNILDRPTELDVEWLVEELSPSSRLARVKAARGR